MKQKYSLPDIYALIANEANGTEKNAEIYWTAFLKVLFREITENGTFAIPLFGKFTLRTRGGKQKVLYNIHSGQHEEIFVPKYQTITFKISPKLKNTVTSKEYKKYFNHKKIPKRKAPQETDFFNLIAKKTREWKVGKEAVASGYDDNIDEKILKKLGGNSR